MRHFRHLLTLASLCLLAICATTPAQAGVVVSGTRIIYPAKNHEITIKLTNDDKKLPRLVQVWLDNGNEKLTPEQSNVPFTLTPPVFRMEAGKTQTLRMVYTKEPLATDKETLFWLNVLEVPPKVDDGSDDNTLRFAFRIRVKVFFRPDNLPTKVQDALGTLQWSVVKNDKESMLEVHNPSPYHVSFQEIALAMSNKPDAKLNKSDQYDMVKPHGTQRYVLKDSVDTLPADAEVRFSIVSDFGGFSDPISAPLKR